MPGLHSITGRHAGLPRRRPMIGPIMGTPDGSAHHRAADHDRNHAACARASGAAAVFALARAAGRRPVKAAVPPS